jgi:septum formation protein
MGNIILASGSPRRAELLTRMRLPFTVRVPYVDETPLPGEAPEAYVERLARAKAEAVLTPRDTGDVSLGADTTVVLDGQILAKPADADECVAMLLALSGRSHRVLTGIAASDGHRTLSRVVAAEVTFRSLTPREAQAYWRTGEPADKAGGYGIQGIGGIFAKTVHGSYSAVVGLPVCETEELLNVLDVDTWKLRELNREHG